MLIMPFGARLGLRRWRRSLKRRVARMTKRAAMKQEARMKKWRQKRFRRKVPTAGVPARVLMPQDTVRAAGAGQVKMRAPFQK
jgi:hypothetical protein